MTEGFEALAADLRVNAFGGGARSAGAPRIGAEVELIPVSADTRRPVPIVAAEGPSTLPWLRRFGAERCWREEATGYGAPRWMLPDGGCVSFEPGGQIELSAAPAPSPSALLRSLRATVPALRASAREHGIELLSLGIDPVNGVEDTALQLPGERYRALTAFLEALGTGGVRMMRQTAAFQPSVDWGADPPARWRLLNAAAPYLTAIFAHSPLYRGRDSGWRSFRARVWRELDGGRTGVFACDDPVSEYLRFALDAPAILRGGVEGPWLPFRDWRDATPADWRAHLTTLFPEVRPKGFAEARCIDAVDPEWYAAPVLLLGGSVRPRALVAPRVTCWAPPTLRCWSPPRVWACATRASPPSRATCARSAWLVRPRWGPAIAAAADLEEARAFHERFTARRAATRVGPLGATMRVMARARLRKDCDGRGALGALSRARAGRAGGRQQRLPPVRPEAEST
jgi:glutamate--cysteine ligase